MKEPWFIAMEANVLHIVCWRRARHTLTLNVERGHTGEPAALYFTFSCSRLLAKPWAWAVLLSV